MINFLEFPVTEAALARYEAAPRAIREQLPAHVVYVLCFIVDDALIPFYVGETGRFVGRMNDYRLANFTASTDFTIGEAAKYFIANQYAVVVGYKSSSTDEKERKKEERLVIRGVLTSGRRLLNCFPSYEYCAANKSDERTAVQCFCEMMIRAARDTLV